MGKQYVDIHNMKITGIVELIVYDRIGNKVEGIVLHNTRTRAPILYASPIGLFSSSGGQFGIRSTPMPDDQQHYYGAGDDLFDSLYPTEPLKVVVDWAAPEAVFYRCGLQTEFFDVGEYNGVQGKWYHLQQDTNSPIVGPQTIACIGYISPQNYFMSFVNLDTPYELGEDRIAFINYHWFIPWNEEIS